MVLYKKKHIHTILDTYTLSTLSTRLWAVVAIFTSEHKYHLLVLIMSCKSLQQLTLHSCNLSGAIPVLAAAFKYRRIVHLIMNDCSLNDENLCEFGSKVLYHCHNTLFALDITDNTFSSKALTEFLGAIKDSRCLLHTLYCDQLQTLNPHSKV